MRIFGLERVAVFKMTLRDVGDLNDKAIGRYCYDYLEPHHKGSDIVVLDLQRLDDIVDVYLKVG
jgi:hypothetical protein